LPQESLPENDLEANNRVFFFARNTVFGKVSTRLGNQEVGLTVFGATL
jgi:hypothetical protein